MISRVADGCFWLTRYLERVDTLARSLDVHHALHIDVELPAGRRWRPLLALAGQTEDFQARVGAEAADDGEAVQQYLTWDGEHPASLYGALRGARDNARTVREIMSLEAWEAVNDPWLWMRSSEARDLHETDRGAFYERMMRSTVLFHGVSHATMLHDEPFAFMKLGRAVERASQTARVLQAVGDPDAAPGAGADDARWLVVLRSCCAYDPFFRRAAQPLSRQAVARFLLFDRSFPRSVLYNLDEARALLYALRLDDPRGLARRSWNALERLRGSLLQMDVSDVERQGPGAMLRWVVEAIDGLCNAIHDDYLDPPMPWLRHCVGVIEDRAGPAAHRAA